MQAGPMLPSIVNVQQCMLFSINAAAQVQHDGEVVN
jgi:hypothetical protein